MGEPDDVVHDQEVPRELLLLDHRPAPAPAGRTRPARCARRPVPPGGAGAGQLPQPRHRVVPRRVRRAAAASASPGARSNASWSASVTERATAPSYRRKRAAISSPERRNAIPLGGSQPSIASRSRRARTAASAAASLCCAGAARSERCSWQRPAARDRRPDRPGSGSAWCRPAGGGRSARPPPGPCRTARSAGPARGRPRPDRRPPAELQRLPDQSLAAAGQDHPAVRRRWRPARSRS